MSNLSFEKEWNKKAKKIYKNAVNHGFWKDEVNDGERMALIHAEISENFLQTFSHFLAEFCKNSLFYVIFEFFSLIFSQILMKFCRNFADILENVEIFGN